MQIVIILAVVVVESTRGDEAEGNPSLGWGTGGRKPSVSSLSNATGAGTASGLSTAKDMGMSKI